MRDAQSSVSGRNVLFLCLPLCAVYLTSFFLPLFELNGRKYIGWDAFEAGFKAMFHLGGGWGTLVWIANPVCWVGIYVLVFRAASASLIAGGLGLLACVLTNIPFLMDSIRAHSMTRIAGDMKEIFNPSSAMGCWILSMILLAIVGFSRGLWLTIRTSPVRDLDGVGLNPSTQSVSTQSRITPD